MLYSRSQTHHDEEGFPYDSLGYIRGIIIELTLGQMRSFEGDHALVPIIIG